jgi:hypothetical protein
MTRKQTHERADLAKKIMALNLPSLADESYAERTGSGLAIMGAVQAELDRNGISFDSLRQAGFIRYGTNQLDYRALNNAVQEQYRGSSPRGPSF